MFSIIFISAIIAVAYVTLRVLNRREEERYRVNEREEETRLLYQNERNKDREQLDDLLKKIRYESNKKASHYDPGGYIVFDIPDKLRNHFIELLRL